MTNDFFVGRQNLEIFFEDLFYLMKGLKLKRKCLQFIA